MGWGDDIVGTRADNDGNVTSVDCNIKTDDLGNETDIIFHPSEESHRPHDHAYQLNTESSGCVHRIDWDKK